MSTPHQTDTHHDKTGKKQERADAASTDSKAQKSEAAQATRSLATPLLIASAVAAVAGGSTALFVLNRRRMARQNALGARAMRLLTGPVAKAIGSAIAGGAVTAAAAQARSMLGKR